MNHLPYLKYDVTPQRQETVAFLGLNRSDRTREGEFSWCENLSDRRYPYLAPRNPRSYTEHTSPTALFAWNGKIVLVDGTDLYYDGEKIGTVTAGEKQFAVVNTKLCIFPDGVYIDLENETFWTLGAVATSSESSASFTKNTLSFSAATDVATSEEFYSTVYNRNSQWREQEYYWIKIYTGLNWDGEKWTVSGEEEKVLCSYVLSENNNNGPKPGDFILFDDTDTAGTYVPNTKYRYLADEKPFEDDGEWDEDQIDDYKPTLGRYFGIITKYEVGYDTSDPTIRVETAKLSFTVFDGETMNGDLTEFFRAGDRVKISGCTTFPGNNTEDGSHLAITAVTKNSITFKTSSFEEGDEDGRVTIIRELPNLDYVCEKDNRLWGVSNQDKTIYASALGDPANFFTYDGLDTDSYAVAVGSEGDFTGLCKYGNTVLAWKERSLHKILGSYPSEFQMATYQYAGVLDGSYKSLVNLNEALFYLGRDGVYAYSGSTPTLISANLGALDYRDGVGGTDGIRYFLSAQDKDGNWALFSYSTQTGLWMREDASHAVDFCRGDDGTKFLSGNRVYTMDDGDEAVDWSATFTPFYETIQGRKCVSRLLLRMEVPKGSFASVFLRCDGGPWRKVGTVTGGTSDTKMMAAAPNRCDKFEIKLAGHGPCALLSMLREYRVGSDR